MTPGDGDGDSTTTAFTNLFYKALNIAEQFQNVDPSMVAPKYWFRFRSDNIELLLSSTTPIQWADLISYIEAIVDTAPTVPTFFKISSEFDLKQMSRVRGPISHGVMEADSMCAFKGGGINEIANQYIYTWLRLIDST